MNQRQNLKFDFTSAIVVFLVAIPLCLGVALASGTPPLSGLISGIIGGIVVGTLSGSSVSVSGPAAGMAAVVMATLVQLGDFPTFLLALALAGVFQILIGLFRAGFIADYVPSNVVQGLLCAIGILLIVKQIPLAFASTGNLKELKMHLLDMTNGLSTFHDTTFNLNEGAVLLSLSAFVILVMFDQIKWPPFKKIPGSIVAVIIGVLLNEYFILTDSSLIQHTPQLVNLPKHQGIQDLYAQIPSPNWSAWMNPKVYFYALMLCVIASLETLLNIKAGEKLDKERRYCSTDRELIAQGVGNFFAGLLGGIPITSVIVRTSVNIQSGAKTKCSTILHGLFILFAVLVVPGLFNKIPLSTLAAILIYTGYKLTKPAYYLHIYRQGMSRFLPFLITLVGIIFFDLLTGIVLGLITSSFFLLKQNSQVRMDIIQEIYPTGITNRLVLPQQTTFLNKASLIAELDTIPKGAQLIIDARYSTYIDKEIIEFIKDFKKDEAPHRGIALNLIGFQDEYDIHNYIDFINVTTYSVQAELTPHQVLKLLQEGNHRFLKDTRIHRSLRSDIKYTATGQHPIAVVLGCIDSRVPVETIFDMSFGDLFCIRIAGNVINNDILASMEYACHVIKAKLIVILGHSRCGAISAACESSNNLPSISHIPQLLAKIKPAIAAETETTTDRSSQNSDFVQQVTSLNIANSLQHVYHESNILRQMIKEGEVGLIGAVYDVSTGHVHFDDFSSKIETLDPQPDPILIHQLQHLQASL